MRREGAFKASKIIELGFPSPLFIYPSEVKRKLDLLYNHLETLLHLKNGHYRWL